MKEKVELANQMIENKIMPTDWIYENIFHLSEDQYDENRDLLIQDAKRKFRITQIENEMDEIRYIQSAYLKALAAETNMSFRQLKKMIDKKVNVYLSAEEAVKLGIADIIV